MSLNAAIVMMFSTSGTESFTTMVRLGHELQSGIVSIDEVAIPFTLASIWSDNDASSVLTLSWLATISTLLGVLLTVMITGELVVFAQSRSQSYAQFYNKVDMIKKEMNRAFLPKDLIYRVSRYYDYIWVNQKQGLGSNSSGVLHDADLSMPLRKEIALQLTVPSSLSCRSFKGALQIAYSLSR